MIPVIWSVAPDFSLLDQTEKKHSLEMHRGKYVLLYFYPNDMTPGCTLEAKCFRDLMQDLQDAGVEILGISEDGVKSHQKFAAKHDLNFPLLADEGGLVCDLYGVKAEKKLFGKSFIGIRRESFLIDSEGVIVKHYEKVNPEEHPQEVLADVQNFKNDR